MARFFDANAALAKLQSNAIHPIRPIPSASGAKNRANSTNRVPPSLESFEERAAIIEFDAGMSRTQAECLAAECQGFGSVVEFRRAAATSHEMNLAIRSPQLEKPK